MSKHQQTQWYNYVDINLLLKQKSNNNQDYIVIEDASQNDEQALQRVNEGYTKLKSDHLLTAVVIPINIGNINQGIYQGSHWVGLVIRRNIGTNSLEALYNDSFGTPMDLSLPNLRQILKNHGTSENNIKDFTHKQQYNDYDCGPWTVFNLDNLARTGQLAHFIDDSDIINNQRNDLSVLRSHLLPENQVIENILDNINQQKQKITHDSSKIVASQNIDIISPSQIHKNEISTLTKQVNNLTINSQSQAVKFIVNVPIYVPVTDIDEDSSDESDDNAFTENQFNFDVEDQISFPYRTFDIKEKASKSKKKEKSVPKKVIEHRVGSLTQEDLDLPLDQAKQKVAISKSQAFLDLLEDTGFEVQDKDNLSNIKVSIGLNRPRSLSTRKNDSLNKQLHSVENNTDMHEKFAFFWNIPWTDNTKKPVEYCKVKHFYKQLKKKDLNKAKEFLKVNEDIERPTPPYQQIRERIKNHENTKKLVQKLRQDEDSVIYFSFIDGDTKNFNEIYSAYLRIISNHSFPTVMSTGYEFRGNGTDYPFQVASMHDRTVRIITTKHLPLGTYYPEPNFCVMLPSKEFTLLESFVDHDRGVTLESSVLLSKVKNRENFTFVFVDDNCIITDIPRRARLYKGKPIKFSKEFESGMLPTVSDVANLSKVSQSHFNTRNWSQSLYINREYTIVLTEQGNVGKIRGLIAKILKCTDETSLKDLVTQLSQWIAPPEHAQKIVDAAKEVRQYKLTVEQNTRTPDQTDFFNYLKQQGIDIGKLPPEKLLLITHNNDLIKNIQDDEIDFDDLISLPLEILREIIYNEEIIELLQNDNIDIQDLLDLYNIAKEHKQDFSEVVQSFIEAIEKEEYSVSEILKRYNEDPLHMEFMSRDPDDIVLENSDNERIVRFGIENYDIDIEWIEDTLRADRNPDDVDNAALMDFRRAMGSYEEEVDEEYPSEHSISINNEYNIWNEDDLGIKQLIGGVEESNGIQ